MRWTNLIAICVFLLLAACSKAPDSGTASSAGNPAPAKKGTAYGKPFLRDTRKVLLTELVNDPDRFNGKRVRVTGLVTAVCQNKGCWIAISDEDGPASVRFKVKDGVMVFPQSAPGKIAEAEGTVRKIELDLKETIAFKKHEAEELGEPFDPASVKEPMSMVMLDGIGAVLTDSR